MKDEGGVCWLRKKTLGAGRKLFKQQEIMPCGSGNKLVLQRRAERNALKATK